MTSFRQFPPEQPQQQRWRVQQEGEREQKGQQQSERALPCVTSSRAEREYDRYGHFNPSADVRTQERGPIRSETSTSNDSLHLNDSGGHLKRFFDGLWSLLRASARLVLEQSNA